MHESPSVKDMFLERDTNLVKLLQEKILTGDMNDEIIAYTAYIHVFNVI